MVQVSLFASVQSSAGTLSAIPPQEVAQHNNLIFAPFALASMENRIFISMLERISRDDETFPEWQIPVADILPYSNGYYFEEIKKAARNIVGHVVDIAPADSKKRKTMPRTIVRKCDHEEGKGYVVCQFHEDMKEYLLKLIGNFTKADLAVLKNFKDEKSVRFYWMLKSRFYKGNSIVITVEECRTCLLEKGSVAYPQPNDLKKHILSKIQKELSNTDCAFSFGQTLKSGYYTTGWEFIREKGASTLLGYEPMRLSEDLLSLLHSCEMDKKGMRKINELLGKTINGLQVDEKFIAFVASERKKEKLAKGDKIGTLGGYIIETIKEGWLTEQYLTGGRLAAPKAPVYKQPVSVKRAKEDQAHPHIISLTQVEQMYQEDKASGKTKYPFAGYVKGLKSGRNIIVEGFNY